MDLHLSLTMSIILGVTFLALGVFCGWRGARPVDPIKGPRLIPWRFLMVLLAFGAVLMLYQIGQVLKITPPPGM